MSKSNANNRPENSQRLGDVSASKEYMLVNASKKLHIHGASIKCLATVAASGANFNTYQLKKVDSDGNETLIGSPVSSTAGLPKGSSLDMDLGSEDVNLEKGSHLVLVNTQDGTGSMPESIMSLDQETVGN